MVRLNQTWWSWTFSETVSTQTAKNEPHSSKICQRKFCFLETEVDRIEQGRIWKISQAALLK